MKNIRVTPQKVFHGCNTNTHGARLDVYIEENADELNVSEESPFDIETEKKNDRIMAEALPRRIRFCHSRIDRPETELRELIWKWRRGGFYG